MATGEDEYYIIRFKDEYLGYVYHYDGNDAEIPMEDAKRFKKNEIKHEYNKLKNLYPDATIEVLKIDIWLLDDDEIGVVLMSDLAEKLTKYQIVPCQLKEANIIKQLGYNSHDELMNAISNENIKITSYYTDEDGYDAYYIKYEHIAPGNNNPYSGYNWVEDDL